MLIFIRDFDVTTNRLQIHSDQLSEPIIVGRKRQVEDIGNIILAIKVSSIYLGNEEALQHPREISVKICIHTFHIAKNNLLPENHLVERPNKKCI